MLLLYKRIFYFLTLLFFYVCPGVFLYPWTNLCHVEPQADGLALLERSVELPAVKQIIKVTPQTLQYILGELDLLIIPACQSMSAPVQQDLQRKRIKTNIEIDGTNA